MADMQSLSMAEMKIGQIVDFQGSRERMKVAFEKIAPSICENYGLDRERDRSLIWAIHNAQKEFAECETCKGEPCKKKENRYFYPVVKASPFGGYYFPQAECGYRQRRRLVYESRLALIPVKFIDKTLADYQSTPDNEIALKIARWFIKTKPPRSLYIYGGCGTGKTLLASIIAQAYVKDFKRVVFGDVPSLLTEIKRTFNTEENSADILNRYCDCDLLVLDDLGAGQVTEWNVGLLYEIINRRYSIDKSTINHEQF